MKMLDNSGEITVVLFNEQCKMFDRQIFTGSEYDFSNFEVREANKVYKILPNPLDIRFLENTTVQLRDQTRNNFMPLREVSEVPDKEPVDTVGICTEVRNAEDKGGHIIRQILLMDADYIEVKLILWEKTAVNFRGKPYDVIVVKGARALRHNNEIKLNASWYTDLQINPDIPEAISLREWYENQ